MAYRLRYSVSIDWIGPGQGPMSGALGALQGQQGGSGNAQTKEFYNVAGGQNINGTGTGGALASADITTLTNAMAADIALQLNTPPAQGQVQGFATGGG